MNHLLPAGLKAVVLAGRHLGERLPARAAQEGVPDRAGAARVSAKLTGLAKGLERDPQVEGLLRGKTRELGIDPKPERNIANELTATLARERTRAFDIGI